MLSAKLESNPDCARHLVTGQGHGQEPSYDSPPPLAARHESLQTSAVTTGGHYYTDQGMGAAVMDTRRFRELNFHTLNCLWPFSAYVIFIYHES